MVVGGEAELAGAFGEPMVTLQPAGFQSFGGLRGHHVEQVAGEPAQLGAVVGGGEPDHGLLGGADRLSRQVVGELVEHARDGLALGGQHGAGDRGLSQDREPVQGPPGVDQPVGFAGGEVGAVGQPGDGGRAVRPPGHLIGLQPGCGHGLPGVQPGGDTQRRCQQLELVTVVGEQVAGIGQGVEDVVDHGQQLAAGELVEPCFHDLTLRPATDSSEPVTRCRHGNPCN